MCIQQVVFEVLKSIYFIIYNTDLRGKKKEMDEVNITEDGNPLEQKEYVEASTTPIVIAGKTGKRHRQRSFDERARKKSYQSDLSRENSGVDETLSDISAHDISDEYDVPDDETGLLILFNHETFQAHDRRRGTTKDQEDLINCLKQLQYGFTTEHIFNDLNKSAVEEQLERISKMDHTKRSSLILVFMTHGDTDGILHSSDSLSVTCHQVWNYFSAENCPSLKGKPKIFIFQACKGEEKSTVKEDSIRRKEAKIQYTLPSEADILVAYSTFEGNVSFRNEELGSWFIQELCKNLNNYGQRDDLVTIITRVSKCVAYKYQYKNYKQMPCFISTLTKKFYLCKSKDRDCLLDISNQNAQILKRLERKIEKVIFRTEKNQKNFVGKQKRKTNEGNMPWECSWILFGIVALVFLYLFASTAHACFI